MGASFYNLQWAEQQWARLERGEKLSAHDQRALLLVYREEAMRLRKRLTEMSYELLTASDTCSQEASQSAEVVYRNGTFRLAQGKYRDEGDLTDPDPDAADGSKNGI